MTVASCLVTRAMLPEKAGEAPKAVIRPYTPTSPPTAKGYMDLIVKARGVEGFVGRVWEGFSEGLHRCSPFLHFRRPSLPPCLPRILTLHTLKITLKPP